MKTCITTQAAPKHKAASPNRPMSSIKNVVALLLATLSLAACSKEEGSTPIMGRNGQAINIAAAAGISLNGWVIVDASQQDLFQDAVTGFVEAAMPAEYLGYVSGRATGGTGFFVGGKVELQTGILSATASNPQTNVRLDSKLLVGIYDEFTGRPDASGKVVEPISRYLTQSSGYVQGNRAILKFTDSLGSIEIDGTFDSNTFEGTVTYDNLRRHDGQGEGAAGNIGWIQVPTCQFFRCR
ncbi:MAG: hypothetical protein J0L82_13460 [Deltaproteobacteria bacterium]|jgi:hypothetical protein|nr:hypothetical protein [Deltaproteobacteria bacterium]